MKNKAFEFLKSLHDEPFNPPKQIRTIFCKNLGWFQLEEGEVFYLCNNEDCAYCSSIKKLTQP